jgi:hypothetical protein
MAKKTNTSKVAANAKRSGRLAGEHGYGGKYKTGKLINPPKKRKKDKGKK